MSTQKRYYWLKLKDDFFSSKRIKKLRRIAGGDTYTIIYLKMQLKAMKTDGVLKWTGLEDDFADELALDLDEKPDDVKITLQYLLSCGLAESSDSINFFFPYAIENVGSEGASAQRWRDWKARQTLDSNDEQTQRKQITNGEKEIEKDIEIEKEIDVSDKKRFKAPTVDEIKSYCSERKNDVDAQRFFDYYESNGWHVGKNKMKDWQAAVRTWERSSNRASRSDSSSTAKSTKQWNIHYD